ncbi:hypothetical protein D9M72_200580 [compost metagenome]
MAHRCAPGCAHGAGGHGRRRAGAAGRGAAAGPYLRQLRAVRGAGAGRQGAAPPAVPADAGAGPAGGLHQVSAVPVQLLAAPCHGRAHAGLGLPALGHHGQGRRVPAGAALSGAGRHQRLVLPGQHDGAGHADRGRRPGAAAAGPERAAGLFHHQPPGPDHAAVRARYPAQHGGGHLPYHQPRGVQGVAVHGGRHHRPRNRHARPGPPARAGALHAAHRGAGHRGIAVDGGGAVVQWLPQQGNVLRRDPGARPAGRLQLGDPYRGDAGGGADDGLFVALYLRRVLRRPAARRAQLPAARAASLHEGAGGVPGGDLPGGRAGAGLYGGRPAGGGFAGHAARAPAGVQPEPVARGQPAAADEPGVDGRGRGAVLPAPPRAAAPATRDQPPERAPVIRAWHACAGTLCRSRHALAGEWLAADLCRLDAAGAAGCAGILPGRPGMARWQHAGGRHRPDRRRHAGAARAVRGGRGGDARPAAVRAGAAGRLRVDGVDGVPAVLRAGPGTDADLGGGGDDPAAGAGAVLPAARDAGARRGGAARAGSGAGAWRRHLAGDGGLRRDDAAL